MESPATTELPPGLPTWAAAARHLLGTMPDWEIAQQFDSTPSVVGRVRSKLGIAAFKLPPAKGASNVSDVDRALSLLGKHTRLGPNPNAETRAMGATLLCYDIDTLREVFERLTGAPPQSDVTHEALGLLIAQANMKPTPEPWARFRGWSGTAEDLDAEIKALDGDGFKALYKAVTGVAPRGRTAKTTEAVSKSILRGWTR